MNTQKKSKRPLFKRMVSFLLVICMMTGFLLPAMSITSSAAIPSYTNITAGSTASVNISTSGGAKYFRFVPTASGTYRFYSSNNTADTYGALLNSSETTLVSNDDGGDGNNFSFTYDCVANTTYYIKAYMYGSNTGSYTLNVVAVSVQTPGNTLNVNTASGTNYSLFNSGRTGDGYSTSASAQNNSSYNNNGYDLYGDQGSSRDTIQLGLSFVIEESTNELVRLSINAYDVDEISSYNGRCHERDYISLVDETAGTKTQLSGYLSGQDGTWNTTIFSIDPSNFVVGHRYHYELNVDCLAGCTTDWVVYVRTVSMEYIPNGAGALPTPYADLSASVSSSGLVSVNLAANMYAENTYTLEYKAVCVSNNSQYGGKEYSVTIPNAITEFDTTFQLESGALRGTYEVTVFIKDGNGNVLVTRTATASYGYSAVSYNSNGGSQNLPTDGATYSSGDTVTVKFDYIPSMYGYVFLGWSTDRAATEPMYTENGTNTFTIGDSDVTLYAIWQEEVTPPVNPGISDTWDGTVDTSWYNSYDTEFTIYTAEQLAGLAQLVNDGNTFSGKTIYLGNNIDLAGHEWTPIGIGSTSDGSDYTTLAFSGTFNGNGNYILGLNVNNTSLKRAGLFGALNNATITMLGIKDASIIITQQHIVAGGVIAGTANNSTITKCDVSGDVSVTDTSIGGSLCASAGMVVGRTNGSVTIDSCIANGSVSGSMPNDWNAYVGGFVGYVDSGRTAISNSYFCGLLYARGYDEGYAGGIIGIDEGSASIHNCFVVAPRMVSTTEDASHNTVMALQYENRVAGAS